MKAVVIRKHGGPRVLSYEEVDAPRNVKGNAVVKVDYCAVNHLDIWVRKGLSGRTVSFPHILGCDICGTLLSSFGRLKKGDKVVIYPAIKCKNSRTSYSIIGGFGTYHGGYAEFISVPKNNIIKKPKWLTDAEASVLNVSYLTAWNMLEKSRCKKGNTILVWGANSGVGSASILLAKAKGIKVITVVSNKTKMKFAKKIGADIIIDRTKSDVTTETLRYTGGIGVDAVIDHVGAKTWPISIDVLKVGGRMIACGTTSGGEAAINIRMLYSKEAEILGAYLGKRSQLESLHRFMKSNKIRPIIDSIFDLQDAQLAHNRIESSSQFGKVILKVSK